MTTDSERSKQMTMIRQGDVLLIPAAVPAGARPVERDRGRVILAYGEVTGHAHAITAPEAQLLTTDDDARFLRIVGAVDLTHEEHATIRISPGEYRVVIHREWTDDMGARQVAD